MEVFFHPSSKSFLYSFLAFILYLRKYAYIGFHIGVDDCGNSRRNVEKIREMVYDQELVYNYIRELLDSDKEIKKNNNLEPKDNYLLDKRFMRELKDRDEYDDA